MEVNVNHVVYHSKKTLLELFTQYGESCGESCLQRATMGVLSRHLGCCITHCSDVERSLCTSELSLRCAGFVSAKMTVIAHY